MNFSPIRAKKNAQQLVKKHRVDCRGLTVLTEAASGPYMFNTMIALEAGASRVISYCRNTRYGSVDEIKSSMCDIYSSVGFDNAWEFISNLDNQYISDADIVTNSGHLRPFDAEFLAKMKPTAVLPLMWEPWELRPGEIDLDFARQHGILIMGTNEHEPPCDTRPFSFLTAMHLAMNHNASIVDDCILIIGDQYSLAQSIEEGLKRNNINCQRISSTCTKDIAMQALNWATYIILAEHSNHQPLIGPNALIETHEISSSNVWGVGVIAGCVDRDDLEANDISVFPETLEPQGFMSYSPSVLGPYPVMDLFCSGLKVGEVMARARLSGMNTADAARHTLLHSPALDLEGKFSWI